MSAGVHRGAGLCGKEWAAQAASSESVHGAVGSPRHHFERRWVACCLRSVGLVPSGMGTWESHLIFPG